jgi:myo-inositol-1(or 4)-monophosphatase
VAAGAILIQEAGGLVGGLKGEQDYMQSGDVIAATPKVFTAMLEALR